MMGRILNSNNPRLVERHVKILDDLILKDEIEGKMEDAEANFKETHKRLMWMMRKAERKLK